MVGSTVYTTLLAFEVINQINENIAEEIKKKQKSTTPPPLLLA
jgi:hypothetical protein